ELERLCDAPAMMGHDPGSRIDRKGKDLFGRLVCDFFDIHAAFGRDYEGDARRLTIDERREIELAVNGRAFFDIQPVDLLAMRAGLMRDERRPQDACGFLFHVVDRFDDLAPASLA